MQGVVSASAAAKPKLRGVLHSYACIAALSAGTLLVLEAPTRSATVASAIYVTCCVFQFFISALYHTPNWPPGVHKLLMRIDHSAIYSLIAATYTPLVLLPLAHTGVASRLLMRVWLAAFAGVGKTWLWPNAPKPLSALLYCAMGWASLPYMQLLIQAVGGGVVLLVALGGVLYTLGAVVYATRWPDPLPSWFGFHEVFHAFVILASICHFSAVWMCVLKLHHRYPPLAV